MNLNSYIEDLDAYEEEKRAKKSFALEQIPQQAEIEKKRKEALAKLIDKFQIKTNPDQEIYFRQLIEMKCRQPKFYYQFKKQRTMLIREKEFKKKEPFHVGFIRKMEEDRFKEEMKRKRAEEIKLGLEQEALDRFRKGTGSNMPEEHTANINLTKAASLTKQNDEVQVFGVTGPTAK